MAGGSRPEENASWERQPGETMHAFARFLEYRSLPLAERSLGKLSISRKRACELSARHKWVRRACAYDEWCATLAATVDKHAVLSHRAAAARLGLTLLHKANESAKRFDERKQDATDVRQMAAAAAQVSELAFGPVNAPQPSQTGPNQAVSINFNGNEPSWIDANVNKAEPNEVLVQSGEKVLARGKAALPQMGHVRSRKLLSEGQVEVKPKRQTLKEAMIKAPVRKADD